MAGFDLAAALRSYDLDNLTLATVCSHTSFQIFHGARQEGFRTLGICKGAPPKHYDAFPLAKPDEFLSVKEYGELPSRGGELRKRNAIVIPHGSFVEYLGPAPFAELPVPTFGNRRVLAWESHRDKAREWLESAGLTMPRTLHDPAEIDGPVIVKYHGAKGGKGFFIARNEDEFAKRLDRSQKYTIQEFVLGTRYYIHYFYSPLSDAGYKLSRGTLQLLGMDRRDESIIDEAHRLGSIYELEEMGITPTFVVTGNFPLVMRESLIPKALEMGAAVVERSLRLFGGMIGPFCLETVVTDKLEFKVFEISARIVAGTNPYISGSPYSDLVEPGMSTGRRIAREIKTARAQGKLLEVLS